MAVHINLYVYLSSLLPLVETFRFCLDIFRMGLNQNSFWDFPTFTLVLTAISLSSQFASLSLKRKTYQFVYLFQKLFQRFIPFFNRATFGTCKNKKFYSKDTFIELSYNPFHTHSKIFCCKIWWSISAFYKENRKQTNVFTYLSNEKKVCQNSSLMQFDANSAWCF